MQEMSTRLETIRRVYFYLVALISLIAGLFALNGLLQGLTVAWAAPGEGIRVGGAEYVRTLLARNSGLLVVTTPVFLVHWWYVQHRLTSRSERTAGMRKFYLYAASTAALVVALGNLHTLVRTLLLTLLDPIGAAPLPVTWLQPLGMLAIGVGLLAYHHDVLLRDGDYAREQGSALWIRRLFLALSGVAGVVMLTLGSAGVTRVFLDALVAQRFPGVGAIWQVALASSAATFFVGLVLTYLAGRQWRTAMAIHPEEAVSAWRRLYLFGAVVIGAVATLTPAALILREGLLLLLGEEAGPTASLLDTLVEPMAFVPVGLLVWFYSRRVLVREQRAFGESDESRTIRRIYNYVVATTALILLWFGSIEVLQAFIDAGFSTGAVVGKRPVWVQPLATGLSLLIVAVPVWLVHWRAIESAARRTDAFGAHERTTMTRRIFLFGMALASALLVLVFLAQVIYRVFLLLMGAPDAGLWSAAAANKLARAAASSAVWIFTVMTIRADGRMPAPAEPPASHASTAARRADLEAHLRHLEAELAQTRRELAALPAGDDDPSC